MEPHGEHGKTAPYHLEATPTLPKRAPSAQETAPELHWRTWMVFVSIALSQYASVYAATTTAFWFPAIIATLGEADKAFWIPSAGLVVSTVLTPVMGLWSTFGSPSRKWLSVGGSVVGGAGLLIMGSAKSIDVVIVGGAIYALFIIVYGTQAAIVAEIFPHRMRGAAQGYLYAAQALGGLTTLTAGAAMIQNNVGGAGGWRWCFYFPAILAFVGAGLLAVFYRPIKRHDANEATYFRRLATLDWTGCILLCFALIPLMIGLTWGGGAYAWSSAASIVPVVLGVVFLALFGLHQRFVRKDGAFNHELFVNRNFALCLIAIFCEGVVYVCLLVFLGQQISTLIDARPIQYGLFFAVLQLSAAAGASGWGYYSQRTRTVKVPLLVGFLLFLGAVIGFSMLKANSKAKALAYSMCVLTGIGLGSPLSLLLATAQLATPANLTGLSTYLVLGIRSFGGAAGSAICLSVFRSKIQAFLPAEIVSHALAAGVAPDALMPLVGAVAQANGAQVSIPGFTEAQIAAAQMGRLVAFARAFSYIYYCIIPWTVVAMMAICFLKPVEDSMDWKIDNTVEKGDLGRTDVETPQIVDDGQDQQTVGEK